MDGLCVIVTYGGTKTYYAYMKFQGVPRRVKIARVGQMKLIEARMKAHTLKERSLRGEDPSAERRDALKDMTLRQLFVALVDKGVLIAAGQNKGRRYNLNT